MLSAEHQWQNLLVLLFANGHSGLSLLGTSQSLQAVHMHSCGNGSQRPLCYLTDTCLSWRSLASLEF
jgi:hypothetical protein